MHHLIHLVALFVVVEIGQQLEQEAVRIVSLVQLTQILEALQ